MQAVVFGAKERSALPKCLNGERIHHCITGQCNFYVAKGSLEDFDETISARNISGKFWFATDLPFSAEKLRGRSRDSGFSSIFYSAAGEMRSSPLGAHLGLTYVYIYIYYTVLFPGMEAFLVPSFHAEIFTFNFPRNSSSKITSGFPPGRGFFSPETPCHEKPILLSQLRTKRTIQPGLFPSEAIFSIKISFSLNLVRRWRGFHRIIR